MILHQQDWQTIPGSYFLDDGEKGLVYAHHDGTTFGAMFVRGTSSTSRWYVDETLYGVHPESCKFGHSQHEVEQEGYLECCGFAQLQRATSTGWASNGEKVRFYAAVKLR